MKNEGIFSCNLFLLIFLLMGLVISILSFEAIKQNEIFIINLLQNWNTNPYKSINSFADGCEDNYKPLKIYKQISNCDNFDMLKYIDKGEFEFQPISLTDQNQNYFCVKRMNNFNYFNFKVHNPNNATSDSNNTNVSDICGKDKKNCGLVDTLNNTLCVNLGDSCPLHSFSVKYNNNTVEQNQKSIIYNEANNSIYINNDFHIGLNTKADVKDMNNSLNKYIIVNIELIRGKCI